MLKDIFSNFSRGFFVTIGRVVAIGVIGFLIYYIMTKLPTTELPVNSIVRGWLV